VFIVAAYLFKKTNARPVGIIITNPGANVHIIRRKFPGGGIKIFIWQKSFWRNLYTLTFWLDLAIIKL